MVHAAGDHDSHVGSGWIKNLTDKVVDRVVCARRFGRLKPARRRKAQDDPVSGLSTGGCLTEVAQLGLVEVRPGLGINREKPPPVRQSQREV